MSNRPTNLLLASLSAADLKLLEPHLRPLDFQQHKILFEAGGSVSTVYFPYDAIISLVVTLSTGELIEAAMVGRDGVIGASAALDGRISVSRAVVQISGHGVSCDVDVLKRAARQSETLHSLRSVTNQSSMRRRNKQLPAISRTPLKSVLRAGSFGRATSLRVIRFPSRRSFWPRC